MTRQLDGWRLCLTGTATKPPKIDNNPPDVTPDVTPDPPVVELATDYTVMLYTVEGGNLDNNIENDIAEAAKALKADSETVLLSQKVIVDVITK